MGIGIDIRDVPAPAGGDFALRVRCDVGMYIREAATEEEGVDGDVQF
jgi:hypothetical protein